MSDKAKIGYQYKPRPRKQGYDARFNDRVLTVLGFDFRKGYDSVQVRSENTKTGTTKVQWMRLKRLVSSEYSQIPSPEILESDRGYVPPTDAEKVQHTKDAEQIGAAAEAA